MPCWVTYSNERRVVAISRDYSRLSPVFQRYLHIFTRSMCLARQTGFNAFRVIPVIKAISVAAFIWFPAEHTFVHFWAKKVVITDQNWGKQNLCKSAESTQCFENTQCTCIYEMYNVHIAIYTIALQTSVVGMMMMRTMTAVITAIVAPILLNF